jgi:hypothetical protein
MIGCEEIENSSVTGVDVGPPMSAHCHRIIVSAPNDHYRTPASIPKPLESNVKMIVSKAIANDKKSVTTIDQSI